MSIPQQSSLVVVGPSASRYKGGIAHFTSSLCVELAKYTQVSLISWYEMYPSFLSKRAFKDTASKANFGNDNASYLLGYLNPLSWLRTARHISRLKPEKVILTWVHPIHAPVYICLIVLLRLMGCRDITLQCHNVTPHETFPFSRHLAWLVYRLCHSFIVHSSSEKDELLSYVAHANVLQLFHPIYKFPEPETLTRTTGDPGELRLLFFGMIRHYKGLDILLDAMTEVRKVTSSIKLHIAGEAFDPEEHTQWQELVRKKGLEKQVTLDLRYIPNEEVASLFYNCDAVVLPYRSATSSGPLTLAYRYGKPVIASNVGGLPDFVENGVSGYLCEPTPDSLAHTILHCYSSPLASTGVETVASKFSWSNYAQLILKSIPGQQLIAARAA